MWSLWRRIHLESGEERARCRAGGGFLFALWSFLRGRLRIMMAHRVQDCRTLFNPQLWIYISWWFLLWRTLLETENSGFNSADFTNPFCVIWFLPQAAGLQRWERPHRPGSHGLWKVQLERAERVHTASLKMLNDTQIKDGLRTDASSLDALIGEFRMFLFSCPGSASLTY